MKIGDIVEYIGGQCAKGRLLFPLQKKVFYLVTNMGESNFSDGVKPSIQIDASLHSFTKCMFRTIQDAEVINITELLKEKEAI